MSWRTGARRLVRATPGAWRGRAAAAGRAGWAIGDQALSSLTNFLLAVFVARSVSVEEFGAFTLAFAVYIICLTVSRAVATDALAIRHSATATADWRLATGSATGAAIVFGAAAGLTILVVGLIVGGVVGDALVFFAFGVVPLLLQDAWRYAFFAAGRGRAAFFNDLAWAVCLIAGFWAVSLFTQPSVPMLIGVWAASAATAALLGIAQAGLIPRPDRAAAWWRHHRDLAPRLAVEGVILSGAQYLTLLAVTFVAGLATVGAVRAGQVLMNALHIATYGIQLFAVPEAVRIGRSSRRRMLRFCVLVGAALSLVALAWGAVLLVLPDSIGRALLGETWSTARSVILPMSIVTAAAGVQAGALVGLRAMALTTRSLSARVVTSGLIVAGGVIGAILGGAVGTAWGIAGALVLGAATWWYHLLRGAAHENAANEGEATAS